MQLMLRLKSDESNLLICLSRRNTTKFGDRVFDILAPHDWITIPNGLRLENTLKSLTENLKKTSYFHRGLPTLRNCNPPLRRLDK